MKRNIELRVFNEAEFILKNNCTVREVARIFYVSKSTVHYDVSFRLKKLNFSIYKSVDEIMKEHLKNRHIKGGEATKNKYKEIKSNQKNKKLLM